MTLIKLYNYLNDEVADPRTNNWFIVRSPVPVLLITFTYLYFVLRCGPRYMKDRPPYKLKGFIRCYDIFQIVTSAWIVYTILEAGWYNDYFLYCVYEEKFPRTPQGYKCSDAMIPTINVKVIVNVSLNDRSLSARTISVAIEYSDQTHRHLMKKNNQISFLHLYHHASTVIHTWICAKYFVSGMAMTIPLVNSSIHVIMYTYYLLSSFGPSMQKLIQRVKPFITIAQMRQPMKLSTILDVMQYLPSSVKSQTQLTKCYSIQAYIPECPGQKISAGILIFNLIINFILFYNFYNKNYVQKKKKNYKYIYHSWVPLTLKATSVRKCSVYFYTI
ncbi:very long chain fatty acid elongase 1-like [Xylocopa sonorina]|uniref:very long chain fatty acid elongase 1-like n=1 Tax=Xylocopa sonorina TaxID=1818115 RepID=UPI00403AFDBA